MKPQRRTLVVPELDMPEVPIVVSQWLVACGEPIRAGDRVIEILAGDVTVDLPAPVDGIISQKQVAVDDPITVGQVLAIIEETGR